MENTIERKREMSLTPLVPLQQFNGIGSTWRLAA